MDPVDLAARAESGQPAHHVPLDQGVGALLSAVTDRLERAGLGAYAFRWTESSLIPVFTVLVAGLESFWLATEGIPVLPTGRASHRYGAPGR